MAYQNILDGIYNEVIQIENTGKVADYIPELAKIITLDMNNGNELTTFQQHNRIYDYIFMCFFLGNDFMPHFPSINIRTGGVNKMINAYKATIGGTNENLTDGKKIYWKNVRKLVYFFYCIYIAYAIRKCMLFSFHF